MPMQRAADAAERAADIASKASYATAGGTLFFGLTLNECAAIAAIVATFITAAVNWYYRAKHYRLLEERLRFEQLKDGDFGDEAE